MARGTQTHLTHTHELAVEQYAVPGRQCRQPATLNKSCSKSDENRCAAPSEESCPDHPPHLRASRVKTRPLEPKWHPPTCSPPRSRRLPAASRKSKGVVHVAPESTRQPRGSVPMDRSRKWGGGARIEAWAEHTCWPRRARCSRRAPAACIGPPAHTRPSSAARRAVQRLSRPLPPRGGRGTHLGRERCVAAHASALG